MRLAKKVARDGEGATKFITVRVEGGRTAQECRQVAYAIAHSPLVKTAFFASDPNLGRILAAVGYAGVADLDPATLDLYLDDVHVATLGLEAARTFLTDERLSKDALGVAGAMRQHMVAAGVEPEPVKSLLGRDYEPVQQVRARLELSGAGVRAGVDVRGLTSCAAMAGDLLAIGNHTANATGTLNVLQAARKGGARRVVYAGSASASRAR